MRHLAAVNKKYLIEFLEAAHFDGCIELEKGWRDSTEETLTRLSDEAQVNGMVKIERGEILKSESMNQKDFIAACILHRETI